MARPPQPAGLARLLPVGILAASFRRWSRVESVPLYTVRLSTIVPGTNVEKGGMIVTMTIGIVVVVIGIVLVISACAEWSPPGSWHCEQHHETAKIFFFTSRPSLGGGEGRIFSASLSLR